MGETLENKVLQTILRYHLFAPGDKVLVAVSGGPDSLCLMHLLSRMAGKLNITVQAVYVNHGLRPEAVREALYVKIMAAKLGLRAVICRADAGKLAREGGYSRQDAARRARYRCLREVAERTGAQCIVTAHHEDDRVENLLLRLLGGSGLDGLAGLRVKRLLAENLLLARPLFHASRREITAYCRAHDLRPLLDRSNLEARYQRNRVRLLLLPWLEKGFGGHVRKTLARTCDLLTGESEVLGQLAAGQLQQVILEKNTKKLILDVAGLRQLPLPFRRRVIRLALWQSGVERPSAVHTQAVLHLADSRMPSGRTSLPAGFIAAREYGRLIIERVRTGNDLGPTAETLPLEVPGCTQLPWSNQAITAEISPAASVRLPPVDRNEALLDLERLELPLQVRTRRPGDRMRPLGTGGGRKLKKILIERKVPLAQRDLLPLVLSGEQVAWVCGVEIADFCRVTPETQQVLRLVLQESNGKGRGR